MKERRKPTGFTWEPDGHGGWVKVPIFHPPPRQVDAILGRDPITGRLVSVSLPSSWGGQSADGELN